MFNQKSKNNAIKKVVFDANPLVRSKSGVGYLTHQLVQSLACVNPETIYVGHYFNFLAKKHVNNLPAAANITYVRSLLFPSKFLGLLRKLGMQPPYNLFTKNSADIVLFTNFVSMPYTGNTPAVVAVYDLCFVDCPEFVADKNGAYLRRWVPPSINRADLVLTISNFTKSRLMEVYDVPESKIHVMPVPPIQKAIPAQGVVEKFELTGGYILFVGTIEPRKNILTLLYAYEKLDETLRAKYALVLVGGEGWKDDEIKKRIESLQHKNFKIIQTGYVSNEEKSALYEKASLYVQPSHYEGFGMPVLEAMSYGKPVLCSNISVFHEVAGDAAIFFDKDNPSALASILADLLTNPAKLTELSKKSTVKAKSFPNWNTVAQDLTKRINKI